jgi:hypothetical protein
MRIGMRLLIILVSVISCAAAIHAQGAAPQKPAEQAPASQDQGQQAAMQAAIEAAKPGPIHAQLMKRAGQYTFSMKFLAQPGAEPIESTGTATLKPILGGRFLEEEDTGETDGQPTAGERIYGYNNGSKQYEAAWIYDGSTAILVLNGTSDDNGKTVRYTGAFLGPEGKAQTLHVTVRQTDEDHFMVRMIGEGTLETAPVVETTYTRKPRKPGSKGGK